MVRGYLLGNFSVYILTHLLAYFLLFPVIQGKVRALGMDQKVAGRLLLAMTGGSHIHAKGQSLRDTVCQEFILSRTDGSWLTPSLTPPVSKQ